MTPHAEQVLEKAKRSSERVPGLIRSGNFMGARYEIEWARHLSLKALAIEQFPPSPADPLEPVTVASGLSPAATPAGAAVPPAPAGTLIDLPEEVPFQ